MAGGRQVHAAGRLHGVLRCGPVAGVSGPWGPRAVAVGRSSTARLVLAVVAVLAVLAASALSPTAAAASESYAEPETERTCVDPPQDVFGDITADTGGAEEIWCAAALGLARGYADGTFGPADSLTRGQMASFLVRLWRDALGRACPAGGEAAPFTDIAGSVHAPNIVCLSALGVTKGVTRTTYKPHAALTLSQTTRFTVRMLRKLRPGVCHDEPAAGQDEDLAAAAACLTARGIAVPDKALTAPHTAASRSQMAVYLIGVWRNRSTAEPTTPTPAATAPQKPAATAPQKPTATAPATPTAAALATPAARPPRTTTAAPPATATAAAAVNTAPAFNASSAQASVPENTAAGADVGTAVSARDPDGDKLTHTLGGTDSPSFTLDPSTGRLKTKAALDYETKNSYTVTITATDTSGASASITVTITVTNVNEAPVFAEGTGTSRRVAENTAAGADMGAAVSADDPDGDKLTYTLGGTDSTHFAINSDSGRLKTRAALDYETKHAYTVTVTATDGALTDAIAVSITVTNIAEAPGAPTAPTTTTTTAPPPTTTTTPPNTTTVAAAVNTAPAFDASSAQASVPENTTAAVGAYTALDHDAGDTVTYSLDATAGDHAAFEIAASTGVLRFKAPPDYETKHTYTVTVTATDTSGASASITVTITITNVNEAPEFAEGASTSRRLAENTAAVGAYTASDPDAGDTVTYSLDATAGDHAAFEIAASTGVLRFKAPPDYETKHTYTVTVTATDTSGASASITVTITVTNVNEAPVFTADTGTSRQVAENTAAVGAYTASDPDAGDTVTYSLDATAGDHAAFEIAAPTGVLRFKAPPDYETKHTYTVTVTATDTSGASASITVTITVTNVNEAPVFTADTGTSRQVAENTAAGAALGAAVSAHDPDGDNLTYTLGGTDSPSFTLDSSSGRLKTKAALDYETEDSYTVTVTATDGALTDAIAVSITVANVAEAPGAPTALALTAAHNALGVSWSAPAAEAGVPAVSGYDVQHRPRTRAGPTAAWGDWRSLTHTGLSTSTLIDGLAGSTHQVRVRAVNADGAGDWTASQTGVPLAPPTTTTTAPPPTTTTTTAPPPTTTTTTAPPPTTTTTTAPPPTTTTTTAPPPTTTTTTAPPTTTTVAAAVNAAAPGPPQNLVVGSGNRRLLVTWEAPAGGGGSSVSEYRVEWKLQGGSWAAPSDVSTASAAGLSHTISGLANGAAYAVRVVAVSGAGTDAVSGEVTATAGVPGPVRNLKVEPRNAELRLSWDPPADSGDGFFKVRDGSYVRSSMTIDGDHPLLMYEVSLKESNDSITTPGTYARKRRLTNGSTYTVQVRASFVDGVTPSSSGVDWKLAGYGPYIEIVAVPKQVAVTDSMESDLEDFIEQMVSARESRFPWLRTAWDHAKGDHTIIEDITPKGTVRMACVLAVGKSYPFDCNVSMMRIDIDSAEDVDVMIHELAHVYTLASTIAPDNNGALAKAHLYFTEEYHKNGRSCPSEVYADTLTYHTKPGAYMHYFQNTNCPGRATMPSAADLAVVKSAADGNDPAWFAESYDDGNGGIDLKKVWAAVMTNNMYWRKMIATQLAGEFGGYCSVSDVAHIVGGFKVENDYHPWKQGNTC